MALLIICLVSVSDTDVQLQAEPCFSGKLICVVVVVKGIMVLSVEPSRVAGVLEEYRQLKLSFHTRRTMYEVHQIQPLVDAAVPEQGTVDRVLVNDYQHDLEYVLECHPQFIRHDEPLASLVGNPAAGRAGIGDIGLLSSPEGEPEVNVEVLMDHQRVAGS